MKVEQYDNVEILRVPPALSIKKIVELFGISRYTVMKAVKNGELKIHRPNFKNYIFVTQDVIDWLNRC